MSEVLGEIERIKRNEHLAECARNEKTIAETTPSAKGVGLSRSELDQLAPFIKYCEQKKVRSCPAHPAVVAAYLSEHARLARQLLLAGELDKGKIRISESTLRLSQAVASLHDYHGLSNPVATAAVRIALDAIIAVPPPRSWPAGDKVKFAMLPADIKTTIARREQQRDVQLSRLQNEMADLRKKTNEVETESKPECAERAEHPGEQSGASPGGV